MSLNFAVALLLAKPNRTIDYVELHYRTGGSSATCSISRPLFSKIDLAQPGWVRLIRPGKFLALDCGWRYVLTTEGVGVALERCIYSIIPTIKNRTGLDRTSRSLIFSIL